MYRMGDYRMKANKILIVDDLEINRGILCEMFQGEWGILEAGDGVEAISALEEDWNKIAIILLDIMMPNMDGFELLRRMSKRKEWMRIPVILITGDTDAEIEQYGYELGASDVIMKPFNPHIVKRRVKNTIDLYQHRNELEDLVSKQTAKIEIQSSRLREINIRIIDTLSTVVEFRNLESGEHINRIKRFTNVMMQALSKRYPELGITPQMIDAVTVASAMHDVGKITTPDQILLKPGRLTKEEFDIMKQHTTLGCRIIESMVEIQDEDYYKYSYEICRYHHERYDGRGYPDGLHGDEIPIAAQAVSVADVYDALMSKRCYKEAYDKEETFQMIMRGDCGVFSPKLLTCFLKARGDFERLALSGSEEKSL